MFILNYALEVLIFPSAVNFPFINGQQFNDKIHGKSITFNGFSEQENAS